jgi:transcriptional regulator NrdR family protein
VLERATGPECPRCGCQDTETVRGRSRWGGPNLERLRCKHCLYEWREKKWAKAEPDNGEVEAPSNGDGEHEEREPGAVIYHVLRCPACDSRKTKITSSPKQADPTVPRIRYHECKDCQNTFKSVEKTSG